ncbi:hypothetical protein GWO43_03635, partial [candidate division KSB1 bacterium]|nr:hypothetical protein [candidate division KSB1 bacterium]NIR70486.1 hypothetical protein [candidate division KSB1 bacterium]NIS23125.1 hypothetical protein [candidate division KSB1 bacterium]NIT69993.1 hypothetical protein [candidate division KSB1 bacterium]NIU23619.1 hypothetical protein [candidate division KSB1 bacterium]
LGRIIASGDNNTFSGPIVGVVKDFHFAPLHKSIEPLVIGLFDGGLPFMTVRLRTGTLQRTIAQVKDIWREHEPNRPMNFFFLDERLDTAYRFETQLGNIVTSFTILAIFVASLGLFGMALYASEQRTKEIGIRKVLGASVQNIMLVFSFDFVKLMLIANVVAWPIAYFTMRRWLDDFAYRINIGIDAFALAGIIALLITLITVSYQVIRAALANPVQALRYE